MNVDIQKKLNTLLDRTLCITMLLNQQKILDPETGRAYEKCLKGLKKRLADTSYMEQIPVGPDIDQIDQMILTLSEDKLLNAAGKSYVNVLSYSIKTVIYGIGVGHKILTKEEKEQAPYIMVSRRVTVEKYLDLLAECERCDQTIEMYSRLKDRIRCLKIQNMNAQKQSEDLLYRDPGILKEIELFWDIDEMTENAKSYLSIRSQISKNEKEIAELSMQAEGKESTCKLMQERIDSLYREIRSGNQTVSSIQKEPQKKRGLFSGFGRKKKDTDDMVPLAYPGGEEVRESSVENIQTDDDWSLEKLLRIYAHLTEGEPCDAVEELMQSDSIRGYVAQIYEEYLKFENEMKRKREELDAAESQMHS